MHIIGAGGHAKVVIDILEELGVEIEGVWDENPELLSFINYEVRGNFMAFKAIKADHVIIAIGNNETRKILSAQLDRHTGTLVHPRSSIAKSVILGVGTVVMANASVNSFAKIGKYVIVNTNASVDHDCKIADFVHISPQVGLAGNVEVGEGTHIGIGASVIQGIKIGKWATIGAGTAVIKDVPDFAVVVGNPGRIIKYNKPTD